MGCRKKILAIMTLTVIGLTGAFCNVQANDSVNLIPVNESDSDTVTQGTEEYSGFVRGFQSFK